MGKGYNYCGVFDCRNNSKLNPTLSFYSVNKNNVCNRQWLKLIGREDVIEKPRNIKVCSVHFTPNDMTCNKRLKPGVIPSLHLPNTSDSIFLPSNCDISLSRSSSASQQNQNDVICIEDQEAEMKLTSSNRRFYTVETQTDRDIEYNKRNNKPRPLANVATQTDFVSSYLREVLERKSNFILNPPVTAATCSFCSHCRNNAQETEKLKMCNISIQTINEPTENTSPESEVDQPNQIDTIKNENIDEEMNDPVIPEKRKSERNLSHKNSVSVNTKPENSDSKKQKFNRPSIIFESDLSDIEDTEEGEEQVLNTSDTDSTRVSKSNYANITAEDVPTTSKTINKTNKSAENLLADSNFIYQFHKWQSEILSKKDKKCYD